MNDPSDQRDPRQWFGVALRGAAMGIAELVPGVSGGTIAFITGIYAELVLAIRRIDRDFFALVLRGRVRQAWQHAHLGFLAVLGAGMLAALVLFASVVHWLLSEHELLIWGFFFGLILASVVFIARFVAPWGPEHFLLALSGLLAGSALGLFGSLPPGQHVLITFLSGAVAVCAWILPGVSGSFILLLLGQYSVVIRAVATLDLSFLLVLGAGCVTGLALFARVLSWLLRHYYRATLAFLCGFMGGSLNLLWPWRQTLSYYMDADGAAIPVRIRPVSPWLYEEMYGEDPLLWGVLGCVVLGVVLVMAMDRLARDGDGAAV